MANFNMKSMNEFLKEQAKRKLEAKFIPVKYYRSCLLSPINLNRKLPKQVFGEGSDSFKFQNLHLEIEKEIKIILQ